jgi:hypothetical protein
LGEYKVLDGLLLRPKLLSLGDFLLWKVILGIEFSKESYDVMVKFGILGLD